MPTLKKLLFPVAFSSQCEGAGRYAKALATRLQCELILLHAVPRPHIDYGGPEVSPRNLSDITAEMRRSARRNLDGFLAEELQGLTVRRELREADAAQSIVSFSRSEQIDLIIMPTHGYGPFRRFLLGSVTAKVLHDADVPVWTGVHLEEAPVPEAIAFRRVLCAVDLGPQSERVLAWASSFAESFGSRLVVFHVTAPVAVAVAGGGLPEPDTERAAQAAGELEGLIQRSGVQAEIAVHSGPVADTVYDYAAGFPADLLVVGRGAVKGGIGRLRSQVYAIIRQSPCPVVSV